MQQLRQKFWFGGVCLVALTSCGGGKQEPLPAGAPVIHSSITPSAFPVDAPISIQMPGPGTPPINLRISQGQTLTMTVNVTGDEPMGFTWRFKGWEIKDATGAQYSIPNMQPDKHNGNYTVLVQNRKGTQGSVNVNVTVIPD